jgi:hypothetical protein
MIQSGVFAGTSAQDLPGTSAQDLAENLRVLQFDT